MTTRKTNTEPTDVEHPVNTFNEFVVMSGQNLPNHSKSMAGFARFIKVGAQHPGGLELRTKQQAFRLIAYIRLMAESTLPDEEGNHSYEEVQDAIERV